MLPHFNFWVCVSAPSCVTGLRLRVPLDASPAPASGALTSLLLLLNIVSNTPLWTSLTALNSVSGSASGSVYILGGPIMWKNKFCKLVAAWDLSPCILETELFAEQHIKWHFTPHALSKIWTFWSQDTNLVSQETWNSLIKDKTPLWL